MVNIKIMARLKMPDFKFTFFGEYGTEEGRSEELPKSFIKEKRALNDYAKRILFLKNIFDEDPSNVKARISMFNYMDSFNSLHESVYGYQFKTKDYFNELESFINNIPYKHEMHALTW